jgi:surface polysaccharide O-acyltransferase-like enzyme
MINSKFKIKKLVKLELQVLFYSILLSIIYLLKMNYNLSMIDARVFLMPTVNRVYWFVTYYMVIYLLSPFLNKFIKSLGKEKCGALILILGILLSGVFEISETGFVSDILIWFVFMYIIGAYIKEYKFEFKNKKTSYILTFMYLVVSVSLIAINILINKYTNRNNDIGHFLGLYNLPVLIGAISTFMTFKNLKIKNNKIINSLAKSSLTVYLLQDHTIFRNVFWHIYCKTKAVVQSQLYIYIGHMIISVICIYLIAFIIENIRVFIFDKTIYKIKIFDKYFAKFDNWINV